MISDVNKKSADDMVGKYKKKGVNLEYVPPEEILFLDADVVGPCAMGGILDKKPY